jgi:hypothetical protein
MSIKTMTPIHSNSKDAIELFEYIKDKLNLPDNVIEFKLHYKVEDLIKVECVYYPSRKEG